MSDIQDRLQALFPVHYRSGNILLINADCMEVMKYIRDGEFELSCVDPPYGIGMDNSNKRTKPSRPNSYTDYPDFRYKEASWDNAAPNKDYFDELFRVSEYQIVWGANYFSEFLPSGFGWIFWNKVNGLNNCFSDGEFAFSNKGIQSRYFECSAFHALYGGKDRIHPTQKPVKLYEWLLTNYAKTGQRILDTHGGSMSSVIAAINLGFDITCCELDEDYFNAGVARVEQHKAQGSLFDSKPATNIACENLDLAL